MDARVIVEVTCPYCHSKIMMKKKVGLSSMTIKCPQNDCGKELNIIFDTNKNPQTYKFIYNHFSTILNVVPFPSSDSFTKIFPLWYSSTIRFTSDRPSPQPRSLVVNPG